jgi:3-hydroxyisobutyrate dehydrogenase-like beta-hydroxyacid dehydrogenase
MVVGFCGLGKMGRAMAANLVRAGFTVRAWNRTPGKAPEGALECATPREAAQGADVVVSMLADDAAVEAVVFGEGGLAQADALHCGMSTISLQLSRRLAEGPRFVAAPVFGRPDAAEARKLWICAGGAPGDVARCQPLFAALGQGVFEMGTAPQASLTKLCGNFVLAALIEGFGEAFALAEKAGLDAPRLSDTLTKILFAGAPIPTSYAARIARTEFEPAGFAMALGHKDVALALKAALELKAPMPLASLAQDHFLASLAKGRTAWDWVGMSALLRENAGLPPQRTT